MKKLHEDFLNYLKWTKKYSSHTLRSYALDLNQVFILNRNFNDFGKQESESLENQIKKSLELFFWKNRNLSSASQNRKMAASRSFIKWLLKNNYIKNDVRYFFKLPKLVSKIPNVLSVDEVFSIIYVMTIAHKKGRKDIRRDLCLFFLLYGGGLRVSEACRLKVDQIRWNNKTICVKGKGGKERLIALPNQTLEHLKPFKRNKPWLFGKEPLSERKAYDIIRFWGRKAGLMKAIHPHVLRHSFATHLLVSGSDLRTLQELLGHKTLTATQKYIHLDLMNLSHTLDKLHPINKNFQESVKCIDDI